MRLIYIKSGKSQGYLTLGFNDGEKMLSFTVSDKTYEDIGSPGVNDVLSPAMISAVQYSDELYRARIHALRMLSLADNNERTLVRKLVAKGIGFSVALEVAREMCECGYIDEERQLLRLVSREANVALSGPGKIRAKLISKGYSSAAVDAAVDTLITSGDIDFSRSAEQLIAKKLAQNPTDEEIKRLLYKNGYTIC